MPAEKSVFPEDRPGGLPLLSWRTKKPAALPPAPDCPCCSQRMAFKRTVPQIRGLPEMRIYNCDKCSLGLTEEIEPENIADAILQKAVQLRTAMERIEHSARSEDEPFHR